MKVGDLVRVVSLHESDRRIGIIVAKVEAPPPWVCTDDVENVWAVVFNGDVDTLINYDYGKAPVGTMMYEDELEIISASESS